ncbi:hypothetical protein FGD77_07435 [Roseovarius sp. M141]|nr:hypothetical protein [Roseovarius sp. M141]
MDIVKARQTGALFHLCAAPCAPMVHARVFAHIARFARPLNRAGKHKWKQQLEISYRIMIHCPHK